MWKARPSANERKIMLYTIAMVLLILWLLGFVTGATMHGFIHVLLVIAIAWWAISQLTLPPPVRMVVVVLGAVLLIVWLLSLGGMGAGIGHLRI